MTHNIIFRNFLVHVTFLQIMHVTLSLKKTFLINPPKINFNFSGIFTLNLLIIQNSKTIKLIPSLLEISPAVGIIKIEEKVADYTFLLSLRWNSIHSFHERMKERKKKIVQEKFLFTQFDIIKDVSILCPVI